MQRVVRHGGPAATTSSAKIWIPASANRLSHALISAFPWNFPDQELRPGKLIRTSGEYRASTGWMSPARRRAHTQFTSFEDSHERSILSPSRIFASAERHFQISDELLD